PFLIAFMAKGSTNGPMIAVAVCGLVMWLVFLAAKLPGKAGETAGKKEKTDFGFLRQKKFWLLTALIFCQNAAETSV
ncbi:hypothetical protein QIG69_27425, partial [Klebsiella pneumoniae]|nr:hypothetical protein [Klebsiella pneumoniae]